jgi:hypothetical protein
MAVALPSGSFASWDMKPETGVIDIRSGTGRLVSAVNVMDTRMVLTAETVPLWKEDRADWSGFFAGLNGALIPLETSNQWLIYPRFHGGPIDGWNGNAVFSSINGAGAMVITGAHADLEIKRGDTFGASTGVYKTILLATADAFADGSGNITIPFAGLFPQTIFVTGSPSVVVKFYAPTAFFRVREWTVPATPGPAPVSFTAEQSIR